VNGDQQQTEEQDQDTSQLTSHPTTDDPTAWRSYWRVKHGAWRTEPEISLERQEELQRHRSIVPDVEKGIYPFKGMKLNRADVEWLLATHDAGRGPVEWDNEQDRERWGLDVRGANLCHADLHELPLARLRGGLEFDEYDSATVDQRNLAILLMEEADLAKAQLNGANLRSAQLSRTNFREAQLQGTFLFNANLKGADFTWAKLKKANLGAALLQGADLCEADLMRTNLRAALLQGAYLGDARLKKSFMFRAQLQGAYLDGALLEEAFLHEANFIDADLRGAQLRGAFLTGIKLGNKQHIGPLLADVEWGDTNLAVIDWSQVTKLGDEWKAEQKLTPSKMKKENLTGWKRAYPPVQVQRSQSNLTGWERLEDYQAAVRANRQLAIALQTQGLYEEAARFAYRAQRLQRVVLRQQKKIGSYLFSGFLDLIAGYGYRPRRSLVAYLIIILGFMVLFLLNSHFVAPHLRWDEALVLSLSSFHGRGFFSQNISLGDAYARLAAAEAVIGLIIEISFIATFTQRFFGR